jgi:hypothetical protein
MPSDGRRVASMDESQEAREERLRRLAEKKGFTLEKIADSPISPMRTFEYGLIDQQTQAAVFDEHYSLDFIETFLERAAER